MSRLNDTVSSIRDTPWMSSILDTQPCGLFALDAGCQMLALTTRRGVRLCARQHAAKTRRKSSKPKESRKAEAKRTRYASCRTGGLGWSWHRRFSGLSWTHGGGGGTPASTGEGTREGGEHHHEGQDPHHVPEGAASLIVRAESERHREHRARREEDRVPTRHRVGGMIPRGRHLWLWQTHAHIVPRPVNKARDSEG